MPEEPLTGKDIRGYLAELASQLPPGSSQHVIVVVGGSLLAMLGLRETTADVDSIRRLELELKDAVAVVAARHDLDIRWLNDQAAQFIPVTFREDECSILIDHPRLQVLGAPLPQVFAMKLFAGRAADFDDIRAIWPHCGFNTPEEAARLYQDAYPHLEEDVHLADWLRATFVDASQVDRADP